MRARARILAHDLRRMARGVVDGCRHLLTADTLDVGIGMLEWMAIDGLAGKGCRCRVRVANVSRRPRQVSLVLELSPAGSGGPLPATTARFTKILRLEPLGLAQVELAHEAPGGPRFLVDGRESAPDGHESISEGHESGPDGLSVAEAASSCLLALRARLFEGDRELHHPLVAYREPAD